MADSGRPVPHCPMMAISIPSAALPILLVAMVRQHRHGAEYPTAKALCSNPPIVLHALCNHVLTNQASALDVAGWHRSLTLSKTDIVAPIDFLALTSA